MFVESKGDLLTPFMPRHLCPLRLDSRIVRLNFINHLRIYFVDFIGHGWGSIEIYIPEKEML